MTSATAVRPIITILDRKVADPADAVLQEVWAVNRGAIQRREPAPARITSKDSDVIVVNLDISTWMQIISLGAHRASAMVTHPSVNPHPATLVESLNLFLLDLMKSGRLQSSLETGL